MFGSMYNENTYNAPWAISRRLEGQSDVRLQPSGELLRLRYYNGDSEIEIVNFGELSIWRALKGLSGNSIESFGFASPSIGYSGISEQNLTSASSLNRNRGLNGFATLELKSEGFACADRSIRGSYSMFATNPHTLIFITKEFGSTTSYKVGADGFVSICSYLEGSNDLTVSTYAKMELWGDLFGLSSTELNAEGILTRDRHVEGLSEVVLENFALASVFWGFAGLSSVRLLSDGTIVIYNPAVWMEKGERLAWRQELLPTNYFALYGSAVYNKTNDKLSTGKQRLHWR